MLASQGHCTLEFSANNHVIISALASKMAGGSFISFWPRFWRANTTVLVNVNCSGSHPPSSFFVQQPPRSGSNNNNTTVRSIPWSLIYMFSDERLGHEHESAQPILTVCDSHCSRYLLLLAGDVERNPGPISKGMPRPTVSICSPLCFSLIQMQSHNCAICSACHTLEQMPTSGSWIVLNHD